MQSALLADYDRPTQAQAAAMAGIRRKLASIRATGQGRATIAVIGDSISEGFGATIHANKWIERLAEKLRARAGYPSDPQTRFLSANFQAWSELWVYTGAASVATDNFGYGFRSRSLVAGSVATLGFTGTGIDVYMTVAYTVGAGTYTIDGGAPVAFSTTTIGTDRRVYSAPVISLRGLAPGAHQIVITASASVLLEGAQVFGSDADNCIRVWDCAHGGFTAASFALQPTFGSNGSHFNATEADAAIIALGLNDYFQSQTKAQFETSMRRILAELRQTRPQCGVILTMQQRPAVFANPDDADFNNWRAIIRALAAEYRCALVDWEHGIGNFLAPGNPNDYGDQIHTNNTGHDAIAELYLARILAPGGVIRPAIFPAQAHQADGANLLANVDLTTWSLTGTPVVTAPGGSIDGHTIYRIQDDNGAAFEAINTSCPALLAGRRYRASILANIENWAAVSGSPAALIQIRDASALNGISGHYTYTTIQHVFSSFGSLATLGIAADHFASSWRRHPTDPNWIIVSLDFKVGAANINGALFYLFPTVTAAGNQASVSFAAPKLQLLEAWE